MKPIKVPVRPVTVTPVRVQPKAAPVRVVPKPKPKPRHVDDDEEEEDEVQEQRVPVKVAKTASQRFREEMDIDDIDDEEVPELEDERETRTPQERRERFAQTEDPDAEADDESGAVEVHVPIDDLKRSRTKPVQPSASEDDNEDDDAVDDTVRTTSLAEFTDVIGRASSTQVAVFTPSSESSTPATQAVAQVTAVVVSAPVETAAQATAPVPRDTQIRARAMQFMSEGLTDASIALRLNCPIDTVLSVRRDFLKLSKANNPRDLFTRKIEDLDDMFDVAKSNFYNDPTSEINFRAVTEFNRALRETIESFRELDNPEERANDIVNKIIKPLVMAQLNLSVATLGKFKDDVVKFVPEHVRLVCNSGVAAHSRSMAGAVTTLYNKGIATMEKIYGVDLSTQRLHNSMTEAADASEG